MKGHIILIPAFNPNKSLITFIESLLVYPFLHIVIVNDGSNQEAEPFFQILSRLQHVTVLNHSKNEGKGYAIKTGLTYIIKNFKFYKGVITTGADGQHSVEDVIRISNSTRIFTNGMIIGTRDFRSNLVPKNSFLNNRITSILFNILFNKRLLDVQSGLRYYSKADILWIRNVQGKQFEFDINVIIEAINREISIYEIPIGKAKMTKNVFLQYDEVYHPKILSKSYLDLFFNKK